MSRQKSSVKIQDIDQKLTDLLVKMQLSHLIKLDDIKNIIYHASDQIEFMKLSGVLLEKTPTAIDPHEVLATIQLAWNYLPQAKLDNYSPHDVGTNKSQPDAPIYDSNIRNADELFLNEKATNDTFVLQQQDQWEFKMGQASVTLRRQCDELTDSARSSLKLKKALKQFVAEHPTFIPGVLTFGAILEEKEQMKLAWQLYQDTINTLEQLFPVPLCKPDSRLPWFMVGNRPILTLYFRHAYLSLVRQGVAKSIPIFQRLLQFDPDDNQGVRFFLADLYLQLKEYEKFAQLQLTYDNEDRAEFIMGALYVQWVKGEKSKVKKFISTHWSRVGKIIDELLRAEHYPPDNNETDLLLRSAASEAYAYWIGQGALWDKLPEAKDYFQQMLYLRSREDIDAYWQEFEKEMNFPASKSRYFQKYDAYLSRTPPFAQKENLIFRVKLFYNKRTYRDIVIPSFATFETLHQAIMSSFAFDDDHLYAFHLDRRRWDSQATIDSYRSVDYFNLGPNEVLKVHQVPLLAVLLQPKQKWLYIFDFGDEWLFEIEFRGTAEFNPKKKYPQIIKLHGEAPDQYGEDS